jgi:hypothetical protein
MELLLPVSEEVKELQELLRILCSALKLFFAPTQRRGFFLVFVPIINEKLRCSNALQCMAAFLNLELNF